MADRRSHRFHFARRNDLGFYGGVNKTLICCFVYFLMIFGNASLALAGRVSEPIPLWPNGAPDEKGSMGKEQDMTTPKDRLVSGQRVVRLGNVSTPTITVYRPSRFKDNGAAVVVCPGGGYSILAMDLEGSEICQWLNSLGVTGILLKYRVPVRPGDDKHILPLQDAQRALGLVRFHAKEWKVDPKRIGILGFSAGGHLMTHLCNDCEKRAYALVDDADQVSCRPDFALAIYPAYLVQKDHKTNLVPELKVTTNTPPTFLAQAEDDAVDAECSLFYYFALKKAKVPAEMHLYARGGHGYGLRPSGDPVSSWPKRAAEWLQGLGVLKRDRVVR